MKIFEPDSIIFDLDGTLWDATHLIAKAYNQVLKEKEIKAHKITSQEVANICGVRCDSFVNELLYDVDPSIRESIKEQCYQIENKFIRNHGGDLFPNVEKVLKHLSKKYPLYIVSNCQAGYIEAFLDHYQFNDYFQAIVSAGDTKMPKAENLKLIVKRNNLKKPIYIGDTKRDHDATRQAGIDFIFAKYGHGNVSDAVMVINEIGELLDMFEVFNNLL